MTLRPQQTYTIVRQIEDHRDTATYYVRAVVRRSLDDTTLATINLTDKGGQRFKEDWLVAQDSTGLGFDVDITTSVYTDSGYTTKSENYGDKIENHRVETLQTNFGGGGSDISYQKVREIIREELEKKEIPTADLSGIEKLAQTILQNVSTMPEYTEDLLDIKQALSGIPKEQVDISPLIKSIEKMAQSHAEVLSENEDILEKSTATIKTEVAKLKIEEIIVLLKKVIDNSNNDAEIKKQLSELNKIISDKPYIILNNPSKEEAPRVKINFPKK